MLVLEDVVVDRGGVRVLDHVSASFAPGRCTAVAGPSGILAWGENARLLEQREHEVVVLKAERDELRNRVDLLDPRHTDPDLAGELLRSNLNVVHPDEMVMLLKP